MRIAHVVVLLLGGGLVGAACSGDGLARAEGDDCLCYRPPIIETVLCVNDAPNTPGSLGWAVLEVPGAEPYDLLDVTAIGVLVPDAPVDRPGPTFARMAAPVLIGEGRAAVACDRSGSPVVHLFSEVTFIRPSWHRQ